MAIRGVEDIEKRLKDQTVEGLRGSKRDLEKEPTNQRVWTRTPEGGWTNAGRKRITARVPG